MLTGPGVTASEITIGTLIDAATDRGFLRGVQLWRTSVNDAGGVCGRTLTLVGNGDSGTPTDLVDAYRALGTDVLGFVTSTDSSTVASELAAGLGVDQIPAITVTGTATDLYLNSPTVVGPTADIIAINALDQAVQAGTVVPGDTIGVVSDGSAMSINALDGLRWYAGQHDLTVATQLGSALDPATLPAAPVLVALGDATLTGKLLAATPTTSTVITTLTGYDSTQLTATDAPRVQVMLPTPAPGADHPGASAIEAALATTGETAGPSTFAGYAAGSTWGRLLAAACDAQTLTRAGVLAARETVGAASVESLLGGSDPGLPVVDHVPATRSSALAAADPSTPSGLTALGGLVAASGIDDYVAPLR